MRQTKKDRVVGDQELLLAIAKADGKAIACLYKNYLPKVSEYISKNGGSPEDARDIFQEAVLALYKQVQSPEFVIPSSLETYLFSICKYQWLKTLRENKPIETSVKDAEFGNLDGDIIDHLEKAERFLILQKHLQKLQGNTKKILELHLQKFSTNEIAEKLGLSRLYVKKKKYEGKRELFRVIKTDLRFREGNGD